MGQYWCDWGLNNAKICQIMYIWVGYILCTLAMTCSWSGKISVMTMTVPTPIHPTPTCLCHFWVIRTIPEPLFPILNSLAPFWASSHLSNALLNPSTPCFFWSILRCLRDLSVHMSHHTMDLLQTRHVLNYIYCPCSLLPVNSGKHRSRGW